MYEATIIDMIVSKLFIEFKRHARWLKEKNNPNEMVTDSLVIFCENMQLCLSVHVCVLTCMSYIKSQQHTDWNPDPHKKQKTKVTVSLTQLVNRSDFSAPPWDGPGTEVLLVWLVCGSANKRLPGKEVVLAAVSHSLWPPSSAHTLKPDTWCWHR